MSRLLREIVRSLAELSLGFAGELTMSDAMEGLMNSLYMDRVPSSWEKLAYPSKRALASWLVDLQMRLQQLTDWTGNPTSIPKVTWLSGMVNPQSFLTAIKQSTAQSINAELDKLVITTEVTKKALADVDLASKEGAFVHGMKLQGASWDVPNQSVAPSIPKQVSANVLRPAVAIWQYRKSLLTPPAPHNKCQLV